MRCHVTRGVMKKHIWEFSSLHFNEFLEVLKETLANGSTIKLHGLVLRSRFIHSFPWPLFSLSLSPWPPLSTGKKLLAASSCGRCKTSWGPRAQRLFRD
jgi:hypothetical protein